MHCRSKVVSYTVLSGCLSERKGKHTQTTHPIGLEHASTGCTVLCYCVYTGCIHLNLVVYVILVYFTFSLTNNLSRGHFNKTVFNFEESLSQPSAGRAMVDFVYSTGKLICINHSLSGLSCCLQLLVGNCMGMHSAHTIDQYNVS